MPYKFKGKIVVYNTQDIADDAGHIATCEDAEIAQTVAGVLNDYRLDQEQKERAADTAHASGHLASDQH